VRLTNKLVEAVKAGDASRCDALIGAEFMWDCFVNSQVIAAQIFMQYPQS